MKLKFGDPVELSWIDAQSYAGWQTKEAWKKRPEEVYCKSRGWFVRETKTDFFFCHTISGDECLGLQYVPKVWILEINNVSN